MRILLLTVLLVIPVTASANQFPWIATGLVQRVWFGADEFIIEMKEENGSDLIGTCGSGYFHVKETYGGYQEFYSGALAALASGNLLNIWVSSCVGDRNIVTGGSIIKK